MYCLFRFFRLFLINWKLCSLVKVQNNKWVAGQLTTDLKGGNYVASLTVGNPDLVNESGKFNRPSTSFP